VRHALAGVGDARDRHAVDLASDLDGFLAGAGPRRNPHGDFVRFRRVGRGGFAVDGVQPEEVDADLFGVQSDNPEALLQDALGKPRTPTLKVSIGCIEGFIGDDMFFYAGPGALRRARLAKRILEERFRIVKLDAQDLRIDFLGLNAIHGEATPADAPEPYEIAVRVAARTRTREEAVKVGREVDGMAVSGVAHTGKRVPHQDRAREVIGVWSSLVPREKVPASVNYFES